MWLYLALAAATLVLLDALIVVVVAVAARHARPSERNEDLRARLEQYVAR